jgi:hypothetical protein
MGETANGRNGEKSNEKGIWFFADSPIRPLADPVLIPMNRLEN